MRFACYTLEGSAIAWHRRLYDEGHDVLVYHHDKKNKDIGRGLIPLTGNKDKWLSWGAEDPNTIYFFDCTDAGEFADTLAKSGKLVIGAGSFMDKLEKDRNWGEELAKKIGILCPPTKSFSTISAALEFLKSDPEQTEGDGGWAWKPDRNLGCETTLVSKDTEQIMEHIEHVRERFGDNIKCILQEKIDGVAVSTARWFNGRSFVGPYEGTLEEKKLMDGDVGPSTGCSLNTVWFYRDPNPRIARELHFAELETELRLNKAPAGLYDINAILNKKGAWFLEWTPRLGIDSELTSQRGISNLAELFIRLAKGGDVDDLFNIDLAYHAVRLSIPPYPNDPGEKSAALGVPVKGFDGTWDKFFVNVGCAWDEKKGLHIADPSGFVGACVTAHPSVTKGFEAIYKYLEKLSVQDLQYRTDAAKIVLDDIMKMHEYGWDLTPILRK